MLRARAEREDHQYERDRDQNGVDPFVGLVGIRVSLKRILVHLCYPRNPRSPGSENSGGGGEKYGFCLGVKNWRSLLTLA
jgi:hypothetical protein